MADQKNKGVECSSSSSSSTISWLKSCCFMSGLGINDRFSDDMLMHILCHLPLQSAVACKLVCKRWLSLISTHAFVSCFVSRHDRSHQQQNYIILEAQGRYSLLSSELPSSDISLSFLPSGGSSSSSSKESSRASPFKILASSNDLLLCSASEELDHNAIYFICSPFTKGWFELPPAPPSLGRHSFGFTYELYYGLKGDRDRVMVNSSCRFRVVRLKLIKGLIMEPPFMIEVDIFSSRTWQWTTTMMPYPFRHQPTCSTSYNGLLYWKCYFGGGGVAVYDPCNRKVCYAIDPPRDGLSTSHFRYNVSSEGSLLAFRMSSVWDFIIWELEDLDQPEWRLKSAVAIREHLLNTCEMFKCAWESYIILPLAFDPNDKNVIFLWSPVVGVATINLMTRVFKPFGQHCGMRPFVHSKMKVPCWPTPISALLNQAPAEKKPTEDYDC